MDDLDPPQKTWILHVTPASLLQPLQGNKQPAELHGEPPRRKRELRIAQAWTRD